MAEREIENAEIKSHYLSLLDQLREELSIFDGNEKPDENSYFAHVPSPPSVLDFIAKYKHTNSDLNFLDIGCGLGTLLRVAQKMGMNATGIELNKDLAKHHADLNVLYMDALKTEHDYGWYNMIYLFRPVADYEKAEQLFEKIINYARIGCIIVYLEPHWECEDHLINFNKRVSKYDKKITCVESEMNNDGAIGVFKVIGFSRILVPLSAVSGSDLAKDINK